MTKVTKSENQTRSGLTVTAEQNIPADGLSPCVVTAIQDVIDSDATIAFATSGSALFSNGEQGISTQVNILGVASVSLTNTVTETVAISAVQSEDITGLTSATFSNSSSGNFTSITTGDNYDFSISAGFPVTAFTGASFTLNVERGNASDYIWTSSQPSAATVTNSGMVVIIGPPDGEVNILAKSSSLGITLTYTFRVQYWFKRLQSALATWSAADLAWGNLLPPKGTPVTAGGNGEKIRIVGSLFGEWGDVYNTEYYPSGDMPATFWVNESQCCYFILHDSFLYYTPGQEESIIGLFTI